MVSVTKDNGTFTQRMAKTIGVTVEEFREVYFSINHLINTGELEDWNKFDKIMLAKFGREGRADALREFRKQIVDEWVEADQKMLELVKSLRKLGYKVGLLTNSSLESGKRLREIGLDNKFDVFMVSAEVGVQKPDPRVFESFARKLGVELSELVFVDDAERSLYS